MFRILVFKMLLLLGIFDASKPRINVRISVFRAGWVRGRNRETHLEGYFFGEYVKYVPKPVPRPRPSVVGN